MEGAKGTLAPEYTAEVGQQKNVQKVLKLRKKNCSVNWFMNSHFRLKKLSIPAPTGPSHKAVVEGGGFVAVNLDAAAQALGPAAGMVDLDPAASMDVGIGALARAQSRVWVLFRGTTRRRTKNPAKRIDYTCYSSLHH